MKQLLNGDCLEIMKTLPDKSVDCFVCDLPYNCLSKETCAWDSVIDLKRFWEQVERLMKSDNTPVIHFCSMKFGIQLINSKPDWFRYDLVWNKDRGVSFLLANKMPMKSHEMIFVFSKKGTYYKRVDERGNFKPYKAHSREQSIRTVGASSGINKTDGNDGTTRVSKSVITIKKENTRKSSHPTEKPKELYRWLLERYCPEGGTILDPTAGSFNSIFVADEMGLNGIGIEMDVNFYNKANTLS